ncbi:TetR/AcrR family transcriptional regulator [Cellulomonas fimi]|uniref:Regulatory protein TetR n=1 Tax=Cellulomonas fimi (strain ATCC 484 / DSM 20113 / JCM 1341 / CCUG 24087 / LMG 16345 / NBRC 15513 / NCIMB 8980 / NCTC 7547 / NRS-133) TaxID=590998 RepID=F4H7J3_CELFA|nr:TetR/AcrR family transcriptional regulator [Cellulomonas fimi]AEE44550.1 regulatory protein TetR [Cellulomonas fimi ATCC 484]NNH06474.1 TetR/AcrR family transcriptional regulator [Cellulomonas fimi]VEH26594.1 HTH-type transcriptional regulator yjdC [Cellulomonas fimi]
MSTPVALEDPTAPVVGRPRRDGGQSEAARRILAAAGPRFYREGIRAVSADAVMADAQVTKATFYRHFPTKDDLVAAYLATVAAAERAAVEGWRAALPPQDVLTAYGDHLAAQTCGEGFRGCPFLNAVAEYPDPEHPVRRVADDHRAWLRTTAGELLRAMDVPRPDEVAVQLVMLRDGAMVAGPAVGPDVVARTLHDAGRTLVEHARAGRTGRA